MLQRTIRRMKVNTAERDLLERELFLVEAGIRGERRLQKKFIEFYSSEPFEILWNTSLTLGNWPVQIDGLLLTSKVAVILESKNISGELHFENKTDEFFRYDANGVKTIMDNPAVQVEKHIRFIRMWFAENKIRLPVDGLLVFTALKAELCSLPKNIRTCRHHHMVELLFKTIEEYPSSPQQNRHVLKKYMKILEKQLTPYTQKPIAVQYSLDPRLFEQGIYCDACQTFNVSRQRRRWQCDACGKTSVNAGEEAVLDYFAIFGFQANNEKLRKFLNVDDRHLVKRLLSQEILTKDGSRRHSKYSMNKTGNLSE
ncbi:NERD domain-containing protein [Planococcus beigongshangi]|uniref:NERD domain-containing protein n=1 Tax=Planococcus beigongshangi TaxID=2782536 RepID=UPI00193B7FBE